MKKPARAFSPPTPRPKPLGDEEIKKMTMERLIDPNYQPEDGQATVEGREGTVGATANVKSATRTAAKKTAQQPAKSVEEDEAPPEFPWSDFAALKKTNLLYEIPPETVAKMNWVIDNVPRQSRQRIVRDGVAAELDRLIALYYKA